MARSVGTDLPAMTFHLPKTSKLDLTLTIVAVILAFGGLSSSAQSLNAVADGKRGEISELNRSLIEKKSAVSELELSNRLDSVGNRERSSLILELDAALNSTEGFIQ